MSEKFKEYAFHYLKVLLVLFSIILITLVLGVGFFIRNRFSPKPIYKKLAYLFLTSSLLTFLGTYIYFCVFVYPVPDELDITSSKDSEFEVKIGRTTKIKIVEEKGEIWKKSMSLIEKKGDNYVLPNFYSNTINSFSRKKKDNLPILNQFVFSLAKYYHWRTIKKREELCKETELFVKPYDLDESDCSWREEFITHSLSEYENLDKHKFRIQMIEMDVFLKKKGLYLLDVKDDNIRITKSGDLRIIDGEFFTDKEMKYYKYVPLVFGRLPLLSRMRNPGDSIKKYYLD